MAKKQDFASKTMKSKHGKTCPVCGEAYTYVKVVNTEPSQKEGSYRFAEQIVAVCKCNEKEVYA
ncbi:hypothetical protein [Caldithrix abyssi]|uniref:Uncharacterized protein n=1 Tax=Caldithrix abyssi DSM 13497 TaxID=880073 RepID=H1XTY0_CALAY|nr:hypothetical protein [Caldithrix abyssi]APF16934.1 hypothetical protein Cabys_183 [Caldithrix abyssi DSM 13497]EHO40423.1 hypothetical protein Calab_0784 [Caldithrix abyssi DSM 13497]